VVAPGPDTPEITHIPRKYFELGVLTEVTRELQSGDLDVEHSDQYRDDRAQLIDWDAYQGQVADYGAMLDLPTDPAAFVARLKPWLADTAARADRDFPDNEYVDFVGDELVIRKHAKKVKPAALARIDQQVSMRLPPKNILDILVESERWLDLHPLLAPLSGFEAKI
jgi:hypothetical protein